jgi:hypothetical protein
VPIARVCLRTERSTPARPIGGVGAEAFRPLHGKEPLHIEVGLKHVGLPSKPSLFTSNFSMRNDTDDIA